MLHLAISCTGSTWPFWKSDQTSLTFAILATKSSTWASGSTHLISRECDTSGASSGMAARAVARMAFVQLLVERGHKEAIEDSFKPREFEVKALHKVQFRLAVRTSIVALGIEVSIQRGVETTRLSIRSVQGILATRALVNRHRTSSKQKRTGPKSVCLEMARRDSRTFPVCRKNHWTSISPSWRHSESTGSRESQGTIPTL